MPVRIRAHHLCAAVLVQAAKCGDGFVSRQQLIDTLLNSDYESTARSKLSGYMDDIRVYGKGILEIRKTKGSRLIEAYRLENYEDFDPHTGINRTIDPDESPVRRGREYRAASRLRAGR